jgi:hypothetical protein
LDYVTLYCSQTSPRLKYITSLLFNELLGIQFEITTDEQTYVGSKSAKINYSNRPELPGYYIKPHSLLFEKDIKQFKTSVIKHAGTSKILFGDTNSFDIFASSFYLVSRYEEYLPFERDDHNRFTAPQSCLTRLNIMHRPLVNEWTLELRDALSEAYPTLTYKPRLFEYISTIDIDQAWKYKHKGFLRSLGGLIRDASQSDWDEVKSRIGVLTGKSEDPFYNFDWQREIHRQYDIDVQYFMQVGKYGKFDKNTSIENIDFQRLIIQLDKEQKVGIHPSYRSNKEAEMVRREHQALEHIVADDIQVSRQHFLMHEMPETYQRLLDIGINEDYTMGYSTHMGFRAGIAAPFKFFDLSKNRPTELTLVPFCCMDITPLHYDHLSPEDSVTVLKKQIDLVHSVGGLYVSLWHNESLSESGRWKGWRTVYEEMIVYINGLSNNE